VSYTLAGLAGPVTIAVIAPGHTPAARGPFEMSAAGGEQRLDVRLEPCGRIEGVLRNADGTPRPWRTVAVGPPEGVPRDCPLPTAITKLDGSFPLADEVIVGPGEIVGLDLVR